MLTRRLVEVRRLVDGLSEVIQSDALGSWLKTPNAAFAGLKPLEMIERGESDRLGSKIFFLRSGVASQKDALFGPASKGRRHSLRCQCEEHRRALA